MTTVVVAAAQVEVAVGDGAADAYEVVGATEPVSLVEQTGARVEVVLDAATDEAEAARAEHAQTLAGGQRDARLDRRCHAAQHVGRDLQETTVRVR